MRLTEATVLPFDYFDYAAQLREFLDDAIKLAKRRDLLETIDEKALSEIVDLFAKEAEASLKNGQELIAHLEKRDSTSADQTPDEVKLRRFNDALIATERALTDERGLRGRNWYKHQIYAPGFYTGYAALALPDLQQGLNDRNPEHAREGLNRIVQALKRATDTLRQANQLKPGSNY
jgi:N-acetylated-alpha-linked acidic dipeptidase